MKNPFIMLNVADVGEQYINVDHIIEFGKSKGDVFKSWLMVSGESDIIRAKETPEDIINKIDYRM